MSIEITTTDDRDEWNDLIEKSPHATPFHRYESLAVIADHSNSTLHPYVGYKGQEPVGAFPIFSLTKGPVRATFSPPPDLKISYLGPALVNQQKQKRRRRERTNRRFIDGCLEKMSAELDPKFTNIRTSYRYTDSRPFIWKDFKSTPRYTYVVDLRPDEEDLIMQFSSDARRNIRRTDEASYEIYEGDERDIERCLDRIKHRHDEQGVSFNVTASFVKNLYRAMPDGSVRVYVCESDDGFVGGNICLEHDDTIYRWQSGADHSSDLPVNDLLDWATMQRARARDIEYYDLVGANHKRICKYKSKFGPELALFQQIQRGTRGMNVVSELYKRIR
ncbi:lipid II:glycine glycyltransferase FemX (plasmid) [Haloferacaceae archaeon DSL9]